MRRRVATWSGLFLTLGGWVGASAVLGGGGALAQSPTVQIERFQQASFYPAEGTGTRPLTVLAIGSDARPGDPVAEHLADSIHLITANPEERAATVLGFPRDSYVEIPGVGTRKINEALFYGGPERLAEAVEGITAIPIDYYVLTGFDGFKKMVNDIGGIPVDVPYPMNDSASGALFEQGLNEMDGQQALAFARNRKGTPNGDFSRSENQGLLIASALVKLEQDYFHDPVTLFKWLVTGLAHLETDLSPEELLDLAVTAIQVDPAQVTNLVAPGGVGSAGDASVVFISDAAQPIYADMRDDGIINNSAG